MTNSTHRIIYIPLLIVILFSCKTDSNQFFNIKELNRDVYKGIGIDILQFKQKIDADLSSNPKFYDEAMNDFILSANSEIFKKYGLNHIKDNGDSIQVKNEVNYKKSMLSSLQSSLVMDNCKHDKTDSSCIWKQRIKEWVENKINEKVLYIDYLDVCEGFQRMYHEKYINEEEYKFIVVYMHILASIDALNNKPPKWIEQNEMNK